MFRRFGTMLPLAAGALLLCERSSYADEASKAQAQKLFDEGLRLMDAGRYSEACPNFAQSQKLDPAGGTLLNLALCHEREGKTATALAEYRTALAQATRDDKKERQAFAQERIDLLAAMVPKVVLRQAEGAATPPEVSLDGEAIPHEQFGIPMPLNPGSHRMVVRENGINEREVIFVLRTGEARELKLYVPDTVGQLGVFAANEREDASPRAKVGPILGWAGAGALTVSAVTGIFAIANYVQYRNDCVDGRNYCRTQDGVDAASRTNTHAILSTVFLGVGAACLIAIPILPSTSGKDKVTTSAAVTPGGGSLILRGAF